MPKPQTTETWSWVCFLAGIAIWTIEIALRAMGKLTIDQFTASMFIPIGIMAFGSFLWWRSKRHKSFAPGSR